MAPPYTEATLTGEAAKTHAQKKPFGPGLPLEVAQNVEKLEIICSSFSDPGPDWTEYRAYDAEGNLITTVDEKGY